jgi:hypothetical protein
MSKLVGNIDWNKMRENIVEGEKKKNFTNKKEDPRFFKAKMKDDGTATVIIRFLPSPDTDIPFVKAYNHGFQNASGAWYIENCPTTVPGSPCPVCEANNVSWKSGDQETAKKRKRKLQYWCNILVVKDPQTPENDGKVFIMRYGFKIHEKIMDAINPKEGDIDDDGNQIKPIMIFDMKEGANFKLTIKMTKDGPNYDASKFTSISSLSEEQQKSALGTLYPLTEFSNPNIFKSYDELKERFEKALSVKSSPKKETTPEPESKPNTPVNGSTDVDGSDDDFFNSLRK